MVRTARLPVRGSSPLTRGKHRLVSASLLRHGLIPAHAGKTASVPAHDHLPWAHPRSRGENLLLVLPSGSIQGSSPLTRGKRRARHSCSARRRLIPAHAGKTRVALNQAPFARAHPRSRGENFVRSRARLIGLGSSPLTRGKHDRELRRRHVPGLIPAHAGKTRPRASSPACTGAHPRSRGENAHPGRSTRHRRWLIPAHAGKTVAGDLVSHVCPAHPRSRGENLFTASARDDPWGSSPLTRGKLPISYLKLGPSGLIPAHAGKTRPRGPGQRRAGAHPRSRGENPDAPGIASANWGSSPLTRGKHNCESSFHYLGRLIPAHAGKTGSAGLRWNTDRAHPRSRGKNARHAT